VLARPPSFASLWWSSLAGHYFTIVPNILPHLRAYVSQVAGAGHVALSFAHAFGAALENESRPWRGHVSDPVLGDVALAGQLHAPPGATRLVVCVHGLGGNSSSPYLLPAARQAAELGWACLRLDMRGADGSGEDFYHAALTADLHAALASPELAGYTDIYVIGYSLGGHLALRLASEPHDARVVAVAAICSPIDLARSAAAIDRPALWLYRHYVLRQLKRSYREVARRHPVPTPLERVLEVQTIREWDACTVVPRHGFASTADYYTRASAAGRLDALRVPALMVNTEHDPMVPADSVRPALPSAAPLLTVRWLPSGGHVGLPVSIDLGEAAPLGLQPQVFAWLERAAAGRRAHENP
jgi:predicted alpha/beta-fold hydrolase